MLFFFRESSPYKGPDWKSQVKPLKLFLAIFFQNILFSNKFPACNYYFDLFTIKIYLQLCLGSHLWHTLTIKIFPHLVLYKLTKSQYQNYFLSQDIKQYMFLNSCLATWWHQKLKDLSSIIVSNNGWQAGKEGGRKVQQIELFENEKSFLDEIKIFHKGCHFVKTNSDTSFKVWHIPYQGIKIFLKSSLKLLETTEKYVFIEWRTKS